MFLYSVCTGFCRGLVGFCQGFWVECMFVGLFKNSDLYYFLYIEFFTGFANSE